MDNASVALMFPGQGSQEPGMGRDLTDAFPEAREIFERADATLGRSISRLCFEGSEEELRRTSNTQPALYVVSAAALAVLRARGFDGAFALGHSLGEYTALHAAGSLDFETGLRLVDVRGRAMESAGAARPGAMAAILGLDDALLPEVCAAASRDGAVVVPANWNCPAQAVISGDPSAVEAAIEGAKAAGAKRAMPLNVGGAFHSPLMAPAREELRAALAEAVIAPPRLRFVANADADFLDDPEAIRESLARQIVSPVRWTECVRRAAAAGAGTMIEVGPGKVLVGLLKRIDKGIAGFGFSAPGDLDSLGKLGK